jgi:hypothetical protein
LTVRPTFTERRAGMTPIGRSFHTCSGKIIEPPASRTSASNASITATSTSTRHTAQRAFPVEAQLTDPVQSTTSAAPAEAAAGLESRCTTDSGKSSLREVEGRHPQRTLSPLVGVKCALQRQERTLDPPIATKEVVDCHRRGRAGASAIARRVNGIEREFARFRGGLGCVERDRGSLHNAARLQGRSRPRPTWE